MGAAIDVVRGLLPSRGGVPPVIDLDPAYYKAARAFEGRFPVGPPSLVTCERLTVCGDVTFGRDVAVRGAVTVEGPARTEDGVLLER
jgi:UTP--glucose-1-phosphate uridylyltransferase